MTKTVNLKKLKGMKLYLILKKGAKKKDNGHL